MRRFIIIIVMLSHAFSGCCQDLFHHEFDEVELQFKVAQIDEFMRRFNYDTAYDGSSPLDKSDSLYVSERVKNMATLFNLDKYGNRHNMLDSLSSSLCNYVIEKELRLDYKESLWYALVNISATYEKKNQIISFYLRPEQIKGDEYKWVIFDVYSPIIAVEETKDSLLILPSEHGIGFVSLPEKIKLRPKAVNTLFTKNYKYDSLSVLQFLISNQLLKVGSVQKTVFHFDLPDYSFDVERIEKGKDYNKGWIINSINQKTN